MNLLPFNVFFTISAEKYYQTKENCISKNGDFITAPEASQMFCHAVAAWVYNAIQNCNKPISLVEFGPGYGTLMSEIMCFLQMDEKIFNQIHNIFLIENSESMIVKQKCKLIDSKVQWIKSIEQLPVDNSIIFLANEFFDAMPVKQFVMSDNHFYEIYVNDYKLVRGTEQISHNHMKKMMQYSHCEPNDFQNGEIYELSIVSLSILNEIAVILEKQGGSALIIDYGYDIPKKRNTIQAIANHEILNDFLQQPGTADISAQVDFGAMKNFLSSQYKNLQTHLDNQRNFLIHNHIYAIADKARRHAKNDIDLKKIELELEKILVSMGQFQVLEIKSTTQVNVE